MSRKADIAAMRREVGHNDLNTYLIEPRSAVLDRHPLLAQAEAWWRAGIRKRRPMCIGCKRPFTDNVEVGLLLFSTAVVLPTTASVSAFCCKCAREKSPAEIDAAATRVLRKLMPKGSFEDAR